MEEKEEVHEPVSTQPIHLNRISFIRSTWKLAFSQKALLLSLILPFFSVNFE